MKTTTAPKGPLVLVALGIFLAFFASFFWPGPYRVDEVGLGEGRSVLVRVNRFTGRTESFFGGYNAGWKQRDPGAALQPSTMLFVGVSGLLACCALAYAAGRHDRPSAST